MWLVIESTTMCHRGKFRKWLFILAHRADEGVIMLQIGKLVNAQIRHTTSPDLSPLQAVRIQLWISIARGSADNAVM